MRFFGFVALAVLGGCTKQDKLVGEWTYQRQVQGMEVPHTVTFGSDGSYKCVGVLTGPQGTGFSSTDTGRWEWTADKKLKVKVTDVVWDPIGLPADREAAFRSKFTQQKAQIMAGVKNQPPSLITWESDDRFVCTEPQGDVVYSRVR